MPTLQYDGLITIATGSSRRSASWKTKEMLWSEFVDKLGRVTRTQETQQEYFRMPKEERDNAKDVGGFVGGTLKGGRRKIDAVLQRRLITLDMDSITAGEDPWPTVELILGCAAVLYSTHSHTAKAPRLRLVLPLSRPVSPEEYEATSRQASSNYGIGYDGRIGMYVEEKDRSWCSSNAANDNRAITIEVASDTKEPYAVNAKAYAALIDLLVDICKRNGIKELVWSTNKADRVNHKNGCNMTVHRDYANKSCPGTYLYERHAQIASEVNKRLGSTNIKPAPEKPSGGLYRVQTGAFKSKTNADAMLAKVKAKGFDTYMVKVGDLYKIQVGAFKVKANAEAMMKKLQAAGFSAFITTEEGADKSVDELAREVLQGKWGNGAERKKRLEAAGYDYAVVQKKVNQLA